MRDAKDSPETLAKAINRSYKFVNASVVLAIGTYLFWFWLSKDRGISGNPDAWGQFGDYLGGVLNPLVAYFAFYWLTKSVSLQKEELAETRKALEDSSKSQEIQANAAQKSVRVAALSSLVNSIMGEIQVQRLQIQFLLDQAEKHHAGAARALDGTLIGPRELPEYLRDLNERISLRMTERLSYEEELKQLLQS